MWTFYFAYVGNALSIVTLHLIKWKDENGQIQTFRLVDHVSATWHIFGLLLELSQNQLNTWEEFYRGDANMCWARVMEYWLTCQSSDSNYPVTWEGLYTLLNDAEYSQVAVDLRRAVMGASYVKEEVINLDDGDTLSIESSFASGADTTSTDGSDADNLCK